ncbi:MAG: NADH-quinone oxidoreductase subunit N, partial [Anaerolineae bacterium]
LLPELVLGAAGLAVFGCDLIWRDEAKKHWLPYLALGGLALALIATASLWGANYTLLGGMFTVDPFALFFKLMAVIATALVILAAIEYLAGRTPYRGEFYSLFLFASLSMTLAVSATNLIMIYLAMEFLSITSYILAGYIREDVKSSEAAIKYFLYGAVASGVMLYGMSLLYGATGTTELSAIATALAGEGTAPSIQWLAVPAIILLLTGFGFKIALVPFHQWAPDTYEGAPTPVTAFLSVGPKAVGFAILMRVFLTALPHFQIEWTAILAGISMVTMTLGNLVALRQTNIKRMLAYSSIAHAGYILIGFVCLYLASESPFKGINGALFYLLAYLFTNLGAFVAVIAFEQATGSCEIADYSGLAGRSPFLAGTFLVFLLSLTGIPGTGGFFGKFFVLGAAIQVQFYVLAVVGIINSVIAAFYYLNVVKAMFFEPKAEGANRIPVPPTMGLVLVVALIMTLLLGLYPQPFINLASQSMQILAAL